MHELNSGDLTLTRMVGTIAVIWLTISLEVVVSFTYHKKTGLRATEWPPSLKPLG